MAAKVKKEEDALTAFARLAKEQGMTYGQLQTLETTGKIMVVDGELYKIKPKRKRRPKK